MTRTGAGSGWSPLTRQLIEAARDEDLGAGDLTAQLLRDAGAHVTARLVAREAGVICGLALAPAICDAFERRLSADLEYGPATNAGPARQDGDAVEPGAVVGELRGRRAAVLSCERTLLNFLTRMSGVATLTRTYVDAARAANPNVVILDTRKTMPGWRELDKYAVRCGGGHNHRTGLYDAVLIKDNHLAGVQVADLAQHLRELVARVPAGAKFIEVEVDNLDQFAEVCRVPGISIVLLDNFTPELMRTAVRMRDALRLGPRDHGERVLLLEASGGVSLKTVGAIAATGVDRISIGALTHSAPGLDIGLDM